MSESPHAAPRHESTRGLNRVFKAIILVVVIGGVGSVFWFGNLMNAVAGVFSHQVDPMPFDSDIWKVNEPIETYESVRLRMADDLVKNVLAEGLHESRMHQLLGFPDPYQPLPGYDVMYFLGATTDGNGDHTHWLAIKFNNRGEIQFFKLATE